MRVNKRKQQYVHIDSYLQQTHNRKITEESILPIELQWITKKFIHKAKLFFYLKDILSTEIVKYIYGIYFKHKYFKYFIDYIEPIYDENYNILNKDIVGNKLLIINEEFYDDYGVSYTDYHECCHNLCTQKVYGSLYCKKHMLCFCGFNRRFKHCKIHEYKTNSTNYNIMGDNIRSFCTKNKVEKDNSNKLQQDNNIIDKLFSSNKSLTLPIKGILNNHIIFHAKYIDQDCVSRALGSVIYDRYYIQLIIPLSKILELNTLQHEKLVDTIKLLPELKEFLSVTKLR